MSADSFDGSGMVGVSGNVGDAQALPPPQPPISIVPVPAIPPNYVNGPPHLKPTTNPNVGRLYKGWPILSLSDFTERVWYPMIYDPKGTYIFGVKNPYKNLLQGNGQWTLRFYTRMFGDNPQTVANNGGIDYHPSDFDVQHYWAAIHQPRPLFIFGNNDGQLGTQVYYYPVGDLLVPIGSVQVPATSNWTDIRPGLIFIAGVIFSAFGAPVLTAEIEGLATGAEVATTAELTTAQTVTLVSNTAGQVTGNQNLGLIGKGINLASGNIGGASATTGVSAVDDTLLDSVDYSSGEAATAFTDAQTVDYGFGGTIPGSDPSTIDVPSITADPSADPYAFNATAESGVSDYGSISQGNPDFAPDNSTATNAASAVPVAAKLLSGKPTVPNSGAISGGGQKVSQTTNPNPIAALAGVFGQSNGSSPSPNSLTGLAHQLESAIGMSYSGQLGANKTAPAPSAANSPYLIIGLGLIAVALFMTKGKL